MVRKAEIKVVEVRWDRTMPALLSADRVTDLKMTQMKSW